MKELKFFFLILLLGAVVACNKDDSSPSGSKQHENDGNEILMTADITFFDEDSVEIGEIQYEGKCYFNCEGAKKGMVAQLLTSGTFMNISTENKESKIYFSFVLNTDPNQVTEGVYTGSSTPIMGFSIDSSQPLAGGYANWNPMQGTSKNGTLVISHLTSNYIEGSFSFTSYSTDLATAKTTTAVVKNGKFKGIVDL